jgi:hypothetical protein
LSYSPTFVFCFFFPHLNQQNGSEKNRKFWRNFGGASQTEEGVRRDRSLLSLVAERDQSFRTKKQGVVYIVQEYIRI